MPSLINGFGDADPLEPKNIRTRSSILIEDQGIRILVDTGPDIREQLLRVGNPKIHAICYTHPHYDHMGGMDDIRPYCQFGQIDVYADPQARQSMLEMLPYCFAEHRYPGVPAIGLHEIHPHEPLHIGDMEVMPIEVMHGQLPILGFRIGKLAYITDMKTIDEAEMSYLEGTELLVVNALRFDKPHHSHQLVDDAVAFARRVGARQTYLIHSCHDIGLHEEVNRILPAGIELAFDGQIVEI
jgi:phosphoribosyl 1,2-cyclic phosphate phosphodiesterase